MIGFRLHSPTARHDGRQREKLLAESTGAREIFRERQEILGYGCEETGDGVRWRVATSRDKRRRDAQASTPNPCRVVSPVELCLGPRFENRRGLPEDAREVEAIDQILRLPGVLFFGGR